jgi:hypothetical protein
VVARRYCILGSIAVLGLGGAIVVPALGASHAKVRHWACTGAERTIFDNTNVGLVGNGGTRPTFSTAGKAYCVTYIRTYHWNNGKGAGGATGFVGLSATGSSLGGPGSVGSWKVTASSGQDDAPNVNWRANVPHTPPVVIRGSYTCNDSAPGTWSQNQASAGFGFCIVGGTPAVLSR